MVPAHFKFLGLREASAWAKVHIPNETHSQIMVFINSKSNMTENEI